MNSLYKKNKSDKEPYGVHLLNEVVYMLTDFTAKFQDDTRSDSQIFTANRVSYFLLVDLFLFHSA